MLRLILSPRWMLWHVLTIGAMITCGLLGAWQWRRAGSALGSALNVGYGLQWPLFAVFFGVMWFRLLRMEINKLRAAPSEAAPAAATPIAALRPAVSRPAAPRPAAPLLPGPSPFGPTAGRAAAAPITDETDPELAAYNRMLATLAERDRASSS